MDKQTRNFLIIALLVGFLVVVGVAAVGSDSDQEPAPKQTQEVEQEESIDLEGMEGDLKTEYVDGCVAEGANREFCACTWDYLVDEYGMNWLVDKSIEMYEGGDVPPEMFEAADACKEQFDSEMLPEPSQL